MLSHLISMKQIPHRAPFPELNHSFLQTRSHLKVNGYAPEIHFLCFSFLLMWGGERALVVHILGYKTNWGKPIGLVYMYRMTVCVDNVTKVWNFLISSDLLMQVFPVILYLRFRSLLFVHILIYNAFCGYIPRKFILTKLLYLKLFLRSIIQFSVYCLLKESPSMSLHWSCSLFNFLLLSLLAFSPWASTQKWQDVRKQNK